MRTLPNLLVERAGSTPTDVAVRRFALGAWQETTWSELLAQAAAIGTGLTTLGVGRGDVVALMLGGGPEWFAAEIGATGIGAIVLALDDDLSPTVVCSALRSHSVVAALVRDEEQFDKIAGSRADLDDLRFLAVVDTRGMRSLDAPDHDDSHELSLARLQARGTSVETWQASVRSSADDDGAVILTTVRDGSLTMMRLTHREAIAQGESIAAQLGLGPSDVLYSMNGFAEPNEHALELVGSLLHGATVHFGENGLQAQGLRQVQPTVLVARPSWVGALSAGVAERAAAARGVKAVALGRGLVRRPPSSTVRTSRRANPTRVAALVALAAVLVLFLVWPSGNDVARICIAFAIAVVTAIGLVVGGQTAVGPLRRQLGLSRCRGVIVTESDPTGSDLLGGLDVPVIAAPVATSALLDHVASETLA